MELRIGTIQDYNNKIVIANEGEGLTFGLNDEANTVPIPPRSTSTVEGTKTKQTHPELTPVKPAANQPAVHAAQAVKPVKPAAQAVVVSLTPEYRQEVQSYADTHNLPQSWIDGISSDQARFKRWLVAREQHPDQPLPDEYTSSEHENNKTTLILSGIVLGFNHLRDLLMYSLAAAYNNPATRTTTAHKLFPNQLTTLPVAERSHDTIDPITPGKAAAALPARFASNLARFLTHSLAPPCDRGFDGGAAPPLVGITTSTITPIIIPMAVKTLSIVMRCSLNNVFSLSPRVESSFKNLFIVLISCLFDHAMQWLLQVSHFFHLQDFLNVQLYHFC